MVPSSSPYLLNEGHKLVVERLDVLFLPLPHGLEVGVDVKVRGGQKSPIDGEGGVRGASVPTVPVAIAGQATGAAAAQAIRGCASCFP